MRGRTVVVAVCLVVSGLVCASAFTSASAADRAQATHVVEVHLVGAEDGAVLYIDGTDLGDGISVEPVGEQPADLDWLRVRVPAVGLASIHLVDDVGICEQTSPKEVVCPDDLGEVVVSAGAGGDFVSVRLGPDPHDVAIDLGAGSDHVLVMDLGSGLGEVGTSLVRVWGRDGNDMISDTHELPGQVTSFWGGAGADDAEGVTTARGGRGNDILAANAGVVRHKPDNGQETTPADLRGGSGADIVRGAWGDDELWGGTGRDRLTAYYGNDTVHGGKGLDVIGVLDGRHDDVDCGPGLDRVRRDSRDTVIRCEAPF